MKLTKGKISKLYGKQKQSRRKNKKRKTSCVSYSSYDFVFASHTIWIFSL